MHEFIPKFVWVAGDTGAIKGERPEAGEIFRRTNPDIQGFTCITPEGVKLSADTEMPDRTWFRSECVLRPLEKALREWEKRAGAGPEPAKSAKTSNGGSIYSFKTPAPPPPENMATSTPPPDSQSAEAKPANPYLKQGVIVLRLYCRNVVKSKNRDDATGFNMDYIGFSAEEARAFFPPSAARKWTTPDQLSRRLARSCFSEFVHDERWEFKDADVKKACLKGEVLSVQEGLVTLRYQGETETATADRSGRSGDGLRGYQGSVEGLATYDTLTGRFVSFELVSLGSGWGGCGMHHSYRIGNELFPVGFALTLPPECTPAIAKKSRTSGGSAFRFP